MHLKYYPIILPLFITLLVANEWSLNKPLTIYYHIYHMNWSIFKRTCCTWFSALGKCNSLNLKIDTLSKCIKRDQVGVHNHSLLTRFYSGSIGIEVIDINVVLLKRNFNSHRFSKSNSVYNVMSNNYLIIVFTIRSLSYYAIFIV